MRGIIIILFSLVFVMCFFTNCYDRYLRVEVMANTTLDTLIKPEITESKSYSSLKGTINSLVISLPDDYYEIKTSIDSKGFSRFEATVKDDYALGITEIERLFTEKGFKVLSRQKFEEITREQEIKNIVEAASLIGADAIIQVNILEYNTQMPIQQYTDTTMKFFESDSAGKTKEMASIDEYSKNQIVEIVLDNLDTDSNSYAYIGDLDCKVIYTKTSEIIWFYRNRFYEPQNIDKIRFNTAFLFEKDMHGEWKLASPEKDFRFKSEKEYSEVTIRDESFGKDEIERMIKLKVVKLLCEDFVNHFTGQKNRFF